MIKYWPLHVIGRRGFFKELEFHRELTDLALERRDLGLVLYGGPSLDFLPVELDSNDGRSREKPATRRRRNLAPV